MYFLEYLKQYEDKKIKLFVDMDGVIAHFDFIPGDYDKKRPLFNNIKLLEKVSEFPNIELYILSATRYSNGFNQKQEWLDKYAPFFKKENRVIISREDNNFEKSSKLKANYMKDYPRDESLLMVIDDDLRNLESIKEVCDDVILLKDTILED